MVRRVSPVREVRPGYVVTHPNRERGRSRATRVAVAALLVISALLMATLTVGGWSKLDGLPAVNLAWCCAYVVIARYVLRWARGMLPIAAALGALMLAFTVISVSSLDGTTWAQRGRPGYAPTHTLFGGVGLSANTLSTLTLAIAFSQALLILVGLYGFGQRWQVEYDVPASAAKG